MFLGKNNQLLISSPKAAPDVLSIILFPTQVMTGQTANPLFPCHSAVLWPPPSYFCFSSWTVLKSSKNQLLKTTPTIFTHLYSLGTI